MEKYIYIHTFPQSVAILAQVGSLWDPTWVAATGIVAIVAQVPAASVRVGSQLRLPFAGAVPLRVFVPRPCVGGG